MVLGASAIKDHEALLGSSTSVFWLRWEWLHGHMGQSLGISLESTKQARSPAVWRFSSRSASDVVLLSSGFRA